MTDIGNYSFDTLLCGTKNDDYYKTHEEEKTLCNIMEIGQVARDIIDNKQLSTNKKILLPDVNKIDVIINKKQFVTIPSDLTNSIDYFFGDFNGSEHLFILCGPSRKTNSVDFLFLRYNLKNINEPIDNRTITINIADEQLVNNFSNTKFIINNDKLFICPDNQTIYLINIDEKFQNIMIDSTFQSTVIDGKQENGIIHKSDNEITIINNTVNNDNNILILYNIKKEIDGNIFYDMTLNTLNIETFESTDKITKNFNFFARDYIFRKKINNYIYILFKNNILLIVDENSYDMKFLNIKDNDIDMINLFQSNNDYFYIIHKDNIIYFDHIGEINTIDDFQQDIDYIFNISLEESSIIEYIYLYKNLLFVESNKTILLYKIDFKNNKSVCLSRNLYTGTNIKSFKVNSDGTCLIINDGDKFISIKFN